MIRYSFQDLLKYQNELNERLDEEKVNNIINDILTELQEKIEKYPTSYAFIYTTYFDWDKGEGFRLSQCSQAELAMIKSYLQNMGFQVKYYIDNSAYIDGLKLTWGREP